MNKCKRCGEELLHLLQDTYCANRCSQQEVSSATTGMHYIPSTEEGMAELGLPAVPVPKIKFNFNIHNTKTSAEGSRNMQAYHLVKAISNGVAVKDSLEDLINILPEAHSVTCDTSGDGKRKLIVVLKQNKGLDSLPISVVHWSHKILVSTHIGQVTLKGRNNTP